MTIPAGWTVHPSDSRWMYELTNPAHMQPVPAGEAAQPDASAAYGTMDVDAATAEQKLYQGGGGGDLWVDWPDYDPSGWSVIKARLLPPWSAKNRTGFVQVVRHRVFAEHYPQDHAGNRQVIYETCLNLSSETGLNGPGECPFCDTQRDAVKAGISEKSAAYLQNMKGRVSSVWQMLDLTAQERTAKHFRQQKDAHGRPVIDATGQPAWDVVPARFRMGNELLGQLRSVIKVSGDPSHPIHGYTVALLRQKTGPGQFDVDYKAQMASGKEQLPAQCMPVLGNLIDLEAEEAKFSDREMLRQAADSIRDKIGLPRKWTGGAPAASTDAGWVTHPSDPAWQWNQITGQMRPAR